MATNHRLNFTAEDSAAAAIFASNTAPHTYNPSRSCSE